MRWTGGVERRGQNLTNRTFSTPPFPLEADLRHFVTLTGNDHLILLRCITTTVWSTKVSSCHWECICRCPSEGTDALEKNNSANTDRIQSVICGNVCLEVRREMWPCGAYGRVSSPQHSTTRSCCSCVLSDGLAALLTAVMLSYWGTGYKDGALQGLWFYEMEGSEDQLLINWVPRSYVIFQGRETLTKQTASREEWQDV